MKSSVQTKARLLEVGRIHIHDGLVLPSRGSHSTAGPGVLGCGYIFSLDGTRVRLTSSSEDETPFTLVKSGDSFAIKEGSEVIYDDVIVEPIIYHASNQAFINLDTRCRFDCAFCDITELERKGGGVRRDMQTVLDMISRAMGTGNLEGVALTTGIPISSKESVEHMAGIVRAVSTNYPKMSIGVEPLVDSKAQIQILYDSGATEIKINLEASTSKIMQMVCPGIGWNSTKEMLRTAVSIFGRGKVTSNIIIGLGESKEDALRTYTDLVQMGVIPNLRRLRVTHWNRPRIEKVLGAVPIQMGIDDFMELSSKCASVLSDNGLDPKTFKTMCLNCGACDITPIVDVGGS